MNLSKYGPVEHLSAAHHFQQRLNQQWLLGIDDWIPKTQTRLQALEPFLQADTRPRILLNLQDPSEFLAAFIAACITQSPIFLGNPHWSETDWQQALAIAHPHLIWSDDKLAIATHPPTPQAAQQNGWIMIPTGGSSGQIRFAIHTWSTLMASVHACQQYFETPQINSCCTLPLYHVSGLMQFLRSFTTGGKLAILPFKDLFLNPHPDPALAAFLEPQSQQPKDYFLSLVPTQLQRLLQALDRIPWLSRFHTVLLGGAPAWPDLLDTARTHQIRLAPTYGMTETASQVVTLKPDDFLQGNRSSGQVLPHALITVQDDAQQPLPIPKTGRIAIQSKSLCLGYYPDKFQHSGPFITDDLGFLSPGQGKQEVYLHIVGRHSRRIISGGENISPEQIEALIQSTHLVKDVYVTSTPDPEWGEGVVAIYRPATHNVTAIQIQTMLQGSLSKFKYPKHWIAVEELPRNAQGKVSRVQVEQQLRSHLQSQTE